MSISEQILRSDLRDRLRGLSNKQRVNESFRIMVAKIKTMCDEHTERTGQEFLEMGSKLGSGQNDCMEIAAYKWLFHQRRKSREGKVKISDLAALFDLKLKMISSGKAIPLNEWFVEPERKYKDKFRADFQHLELKSRRFESPYTHRDFTLHFEISSEEIGAILKMSTDELIEQFDSDFKRGVDYVIQLSTGERLWSRWAMVSVANGATKSWPEVDGRNARCAYLAIEYCKSNNIGNEIVSSLAKRKLDAIDVYRRLSEIIHRSPI